MGLLAFAGAEDGLSEVNCSGTVVQSADYIRSGSYSFRLPPDNNKTNSISLPFSQQSTFYFQFAVRNVSNSTGFDYALCAWKKGATILGSIYHMMNGAGLNVYAGDKATLLGSIGTPVSTTSWMLVEVKVVIADSGSITVRINGTEYEFTGDTKPGADTTCDNISLFQCGNQASGSYYTYFEDIVVLDTTGGVLDSWPGGLRCFRLAPTAPGNYSQWTPSSAVENWTCVDEMPPDDTDYVKSNTTGHKDSYQMADCPTAVKDIKAVVSRFWGQGGGQIKRLLRIGGSDYLSTAFDFPQVGKVDSPAYVSPVSPYDPFTVEEVTGLESGMERQ